jgi:hypothetical protein
MQAQTELEERALMKTGRPTTRLPKSKSKPTNHAKPFETNGFSLGLFTPMF